MATVAELRAALVTALKDTTSGVTRPTGLEFYDKMRTTPELPCLMVAGVEETEHHTTSRVSVTGACTRYRFVVMGICAEGLDDDIAQETLDAWTGDGAGTILAALESDPTLGDLCDDLIVRSSDGYASYAVGGAQRAGTSWSVDVYT